MINRPDQEPPAIKLFGPAELRVLLAICQGVAIGCTWHLWQRRGSAGDAPHLPIVDADWVGAVQFDFAWPLLGSLALAVIWPRIGVLAHCSLLALAVALDQMRIQPEFISVAILLVGTLQGNGPRQLARCHLISLWFFAGLHKLLSPAYLFDSGPRLWNDSVGSLPHEVAVGLAIAAAVYEMALGVLAIYPGPRRFVPWLAALLHGGILASLVVQQWNPAVWPWNIALIAAAAGYFSGSRERLFGVDALDGSREPESGVGVRESRSRGRSPPVVWMAASAVMLAYPALYYVGLSDAYVSWCVYSANTPEARFYAAAELAEAGPTTEVSLLEPEALEELMLSVEGEEVAFRYYESLHVPFPPAERLFERYFEEIGRPGDILVIDEPRHWLRWRGPRRRTLIAPSTPGRP